MKDVRIFTNKKRSKNDKFWVNAGTDELFPYAMSDEGRFLMKRMAKSGGGYVRNHYTFNKQTRYGIRVGGDVYREDENGNPVYEFDWINKYFESVLECGLKPIVELDYMPDALIGDKVDILQEGTDECYHDRYYPNDWDKWRALLTAFMNNLVEKFGIEELRAWYFEVWNEPDGWPIDEWDMFFKLYDIFVDVVKGIDEGLRVGGPACFREYFMYPFLNHVANGVNYVTGEVGTRIDYVSYHVYGSSGAWLQLHPLMTPTVQRFSMELLRMKLMIDKFPALKGIEFQLNEWGVVSNYERTVKEFPELEIRNSEYSALFMLKLADTVIEIREKYGLNISMMLYWGFSNEDNLGLMFNGNRTLTTRGGVCKPIETAHELLSMCEGDFAETNVTPGGDEGVLATASDKGADALLYYFNDYDSKKNLPDRAYSVSFEGLSDGEYTLKIYSIDDTHNNTYRLWQRLGSPEEPNEEELSLLHAEQEITSELEIPVTVSGGSFTYPATLSTMSAKLLKLTKN